MIATQDSFNWKTIGPELKVKRFFFIKFGNPIGLFRKSQKGKKISIDEGQVDTPGEKRLILLSYYLIEFSVAGELEPVGRFKANPLIIMSPGLGLQK